MKRQPSSDTQTNEDLRTMLKSMGMKNESDIQDALKDPRVHDLLQDKKKQKVLKRMSTQVTGAGSPFRRPVQNQGKHEIDRKKLKSNGCFFAGLKFNTIVRSTHWSPCQKKAVAVMESIPAHHILDLEVMVKKEDRARSRESSG